MKEEYLLGIDNGNTVSKAVLYQLDGTEVAIASRKIKTIYPKPGHTERDMKALWLANAMNIKEILSKSGVHPKKIRGIGGTGHGNGAYLLDSSGNPLKGIQSLDSRAEQICREWNSSGLQKEVFPYTLQHFWASQTNSLLAWIKTHEPSLYNRINSVVLCKDYVNYCLTGILASDYTDMGATNLMDTRKKRYEPKLLEYYGIPEMETKLPELFNSTDIIGYVSPKVAKETGLLSGTPVVCGMLDVDASIIGSGALKADEVCIVAGSWSINTKISNTVLEERAIAMTTNFVVPNLWKTVEASATSVSNLEWFINQFCKEERKSAKKRNVSVHKICDELINNLDKENSNVTYHPFLYGSQTNSNASAGFYGMKGCHTKADLLWAMYKGIVFAHYEHFKKFKFRETYSPISIRLTGGGSKSPVLCQLFSNVFQSKFQVCKTAQAGTLGAAMAAGLGVGMFDSYSDAVTKTVDEDLSYSPEHAHSGIYISMYEEYNKLSKLMSPYWD